MLWRGGFREKRLVVCSGHQCTLLGMGGGGGDALFGERGEGARVPNDHAHPGTHKHCILNSLKLTPLLSGLELTSSQACPLMACLTRVMINNLNGLVVSLKKKKKKKVIISRSIRLIPD